jgi:hypothetical protein
MILPAGIFYELLSDYKKNRLISLKQIRRRTDEDDEPVLKKRIFSRVSSIPPAYLTLVNI